MRNKKTIADWIEIRKNRGRYTFSTKEVLTDFPHFDYQYVFTALGRQVQSGIIISPVRGFYVIIPTEYALTGNVPALFYIDKMMQFLTRDYYVGLLNAAEFYGAAHQRPQSFTVIHSMPSLKGGVRSNTRFEFITTRSAIYSPYIIQRDGRLGTINVSAPELTALDLIAHEKKVGGLNRVCTVMNDLVESFSTERFDRGFIKLHPTPVYQRLGYILEKIVDSQEWADKLHDLLQGSGARMRAVPFKIGKPTAGCNSGNRWNIIENQEIDIDQ